MSHLEKIEQELKGLRLELTNHELYASLKTLEDIKTFMEYHVFAVWDFMSLLKTLQQKLTWTNVPWMPSKTPKLGRLINEIVLGEESDVNEIGEVKSHFEMYLDAMQEIGASTQQIDDFCELGKEGCSMHQACKEIKLSETVRDFLKFTFDTIGTNKSHIVASVFTFGREDVIPDMFIEITKQSEKENKQSYQKLTYYLERHIELDADEHGPMALEMISELCGEDEKKWDESLEYAKKALRLRIKLWDEINRVICEK